MAERTGSSRRLDLVGLLLLGASAVWTLVASLGRAGARPLPVVALFGATAAAAVGARAGSRAASPLVPAGLAALVAAALVLRYPEVQRAAGPPLGYANSNAALAALGVVAAAAAASVSRSRSAELAFAALGALLIGVLVAIGSVAAIAALVLGGVAVLADRLRRDDGRTGILVGAAIVTICLAATLAIAAGADLELRDRAGVRATLWERSLDLVEQEPLQGVGPGRISEGRLLVADPDLRWSHHAVLHQGAEQGVVGVLLLASLLAWGYARLWSGRAGRVRQTLAGVAAVTTVAMHASVDHVLHDAAVPLTLAALVGWATADLRGRDSPG